MLTEFQLWVLSTIVMLALFIVSVKLPGLAGHLNRLSPDRSDY
jgi:hypothetical protein